MNLGSSGPHGYDASVSLPDHEGNVLPPFIGEPVERASRAPWKTEMVEVVRRFATSDVRRRILAGLLRHRDGLRKYGFVGFQWLDGSFFDVLPREPNDVDVVTIYVLGPDPAATEKLLDEPEFKELAAPPLAKKAYLVDPYFIDVREDALETVELTHYWYGLFSHQRETNRWRGIVRVPLGIGDDDDADAKTLLEQMSSP